MPRRRVVTRNPRQPIWLIAFVFSVLFVLSLGARAQEKKSRDKSPKAPTQNADAVAGRVSLSPRFSPGQVFRYTMEFQTTTATSRSGIAADPAGPSTLSVTWD